ncbi:hypothetical protein K440DRAFT_610694 [Wilcoxina mikolae CBS 423.85]|nr:hypothetical protein K440DRAFT_610694 [Wilcoxina mikolae CBS 423.85]
MINPTTASQIRICTQMPVPAGLEGEAIKLALLENPSNLNSTTDPTRRIINRLWPRDRLLSVGLLGGTLSQRNKVHRHATAWTKHANLRFAFVDKEPADIRVRFDPEKGTWSYIGTDALVVDQELPTMNFSWLDDGDDDAAARIVMHVFGHAIGLMHEHRNEEGGIPWDRPAVCEYYRKTFAWSEDEVKQHIFDYYERDLSQFPPGVKGDSIMRFEVPDSLTTKHPITEADGYFANSCYAGMTGSMGIADIHLDTDVTTNTAQIEFPHKFLAPPGVAVAMKEVNLVSQFPVVRVGASTMSKTNFELQIFQGLKGIRASVGCNWLAIETDDPDIQHGYSSTTNLTWKDSQTYYGPVKFQRPFKSTPKVVVFLNGIDLTRYTQPRIDAVVSKITTSGFDLKIESWGNTSINSASVTWIAHSTDRADISSGTINTSDVRPVDKPEKRTSGSTGFAGMNCKTPPRVFMGIRKLNADHKLPLHVRVGVEGVSITSFKWVIEGLNKCDLYMASADYILFA